MFLRLPETVSNLTVSHTFVLFRKNNNIKTKKNYIVYSIRRVLYKILLYEYEVIVQEYSSILVLAFFVQLYSVRPTYLLCCLV